MRILYNILFYIALPFIVCRLLWRSRKAPAYRARMKERFALTLPKQLEQSIWVHAVSLGEVLAAIPLIKEIKAQYPEYPIMVTTMTPTGSARVQAALEDQVLHAYVPYDLPHTLSRFMHRINPKIVLLMETELWPNLLNQCRRRKIPVMIANARLSERSAKGYARIKGLTGEMLRNVSLIAAQTQADGDRFIQLGAPKERVIVTGSIKFDIQFPASIYEQSSLLRQQWGMNRPIWIAASTHEGEDEIILKAFRKLRKTLPDTLLVLVPRHPERFAKVAAMVRKRDLTLAYRTKPESWQPHVNVFLGDTLGELTLFYAASDVAFVGGSLVPTGGHNLLEPAALGVPSLTGPHMHNFVEISALMHKAQAAKTVTTERELAEGVLYWLQNNQQRVKAGEQGKQVVEQNRGALQAHLNLFEQTLVS